MTARHQVICGDARKILRGLPSQSAQAVIADPRYFRVLARRRITRALATISGKQEAA